MKLFVTVTGTHYLTE